MSGLVLYQVALVAEGFAAHVAGVWLVTMHASDMLHQVRLRLELLLTVSAAERPIGAGLILMDILMKAFC